MTFKKIVLLSLFTLVLTACGGPSSVMIKPEQKQNIKTIALIEITNPPTRMLNLGTGFGAIGLAVSVESEKLEEILKKNRFNFALQLTSDLEAYLKRSGYVVKKVNVNRTKELALFEDYKSLNIKGVDAILDIVVGNHGYVTEHFMLSPHYRPESRTLVQMADAVSGQVIYSDIMMYGYHNPFMSGIDLETQKKFEFPNQEDVFNAGDKVIVAGLRDAALQTAKEIANALKK